VAAALPKTSTCALKLGDYTYLTDVLRGSLAGFRRARTFSAIAPPVRSGGPRRVPREAHLYFPAQKCHGLSPASLGRNWSPYYHGLTGRPSHTDTGRYKIGKTTERKRQSGNQTIPFSDEGLKPCIFLDGKTHGARAHAWDPAEIPQPYWRRHSAESAHALTPQEIHGVQQLKRSYILAWGCIQEPFGAPPPRSARARGVFL